MNVRQYERFCDDPDHDPDLTIIKPVKNAHFGNWIMDSILHLWIPNLLLGLLIQDFEHKFRF